MASSLKDSFAGYNILYSSACLLHLLFLMRIQFLIILGFPCTRRVFLFLCSRFFSLFSVFNIWLWCVWVWIFVLLYTFVYICWAFKMYRLVAFIKLRKILSHFFEYFPVLSLFLQVLLLCKCWYATTFLRGSAHFYAFFLFSISQTAPLSIYKFIDSFFCQFKSILHTLLRIIHFNYYNFRCQTFHLVLSHNFFLSLVVFAWWDIVMHTFLKIL